MTATPAAMKKAVTEMLRGGNTIVLTGNKGSGKSHLAMVLAAKQILDGGYVLSNIICVAREGGELIEKYPERYHKVRSFAQYFYVLSEILQKDRTASVLLILDEAALSMGYLDYISNIAKSAVQFSTLTRKLGTAVILIAVRTEILLKKMRSEEGFMDVRLAKEAFLVQRFAGDILRQGYDMREIVLVSWPAYGIENEPVLVSVAPMLAKPPELCGEGEPYFDTMASADFGMGVHPVTGEHFMLPELLYVIGGVPSHLTPDILYRFMHEDPKPLIEEAKRIAMETTPGLDVPPRDEGDEPAPVPTPRPPPTPPPASDPLRPGTKTDWKTEAVLKLLRDNPSLSNAEIGRLAARWGERISGQYVGRLRKMLESGDRK